MNEKTAEKKCIKFQNETAIIIMVVGRLSEARDLVFAGEVVLLDRFQVKGKSILMLPAGPPWQVFAATKKTLNEMTELTELSGERKNSLLKFGPEVVEKIACFEVDNKFASMMRQIQFVC